MSDPSLYKLPQLAYLLVVFFSKDSKSICWCELVITGQMDDWGNQGLKKGPLFWELSQLLDTAEKVHLNIVH